MSTQYQTPTHIFLLATLHVISFFATVDPEFFRITYVSIKPTDRPTLSIMNVNRSFVFPVRPGQLQCDASWK